MLKTSPFSRVELLFWNFTIQTLSQSKMTRSFVREAYHATSGSKIFSLVLLMGAAGLAGLLSGSAFYLLTNALR